MALRPAYAGYAIIVIIIIVVIVISIATCISVHHDNAAILQLNCRNDTLCSIFRSHSIGGELYYYISSRD